MSRFKTFEQFVMHNSQFNNDFIGQWAEKLGMSREEYVAHYATATIGSGIDETAEAIPGGISKSMSIEDIAKMHDVDLEELIDEYEAGIKIEMEHTDDNEVAAEIARDHLYEDPTYYTKLAKMEDPANEGINDFSPMSYAKKVADKLMTLADAAKEANMGQTQLLKLVRKFDKNFKMTYEANDHEVGMAYGQLEAIINAAMDLEEKIGTQERDLPGWIQDHISQSYNYIKQANDNFHELKEELNPMEFEAAVKQLADSMPNHTNYDEEVGPSEEQIMKAMKKYQKDLYKYSTAAQKKEAVEFVQQYLTESNVDEALKMLMDPLMHKVMKAFGFNRDPKIRQELRDEIQVAIEAVLRKHDIVVEGTFNDGEIAIYTDTRGDAGETQIWKRGKGYYGQNDSFDFEAKDKKELEMKLKRWGYELIAGSID